MNITPPPDRFTPKEVAASLKLKPSTIYAMLSRGELQGHHSGRRRFITQSQLDAYLAKRNRVEMVDMTYAQYPAGKLS
jgi:excisionase family DNA binding protein